MTSTKCEHLYKIYIQTKDHPHVLEMIVSANTLESAKTKALGHVKEANPTKGRPLEQSQNNSQVLFGKKTGKSGCLVTNKMPVAAFRALSEAMRREEDE